MVEGSDRYRETESAVTEAVRGIDLNGLMPVTGFLKYLLNKRVLFIFPRL